MRTGYLLSLHTGVFPHGSTEESIACPPDGCQVHRTYGTVAVLRCHKRWGAPAASPFLHLGLAVSANRRYGFERFILQNLQSGYVKVTFLRKSHVGERTSSPISLPVVAKFAMTSLAEPQEIVNRLMKNALVRQMGTFDPVRTPANLTLIFGPQADGKR
jgi:hypothetical protein